MRRLIVLLSLSAWLLGGSVAAADDFNDLLVSGELTLDASTPIFDFRVVEILPGAVLRFTGGEANDTLTIIASESIRIDGVLDAMFANGLYLAAPTIQIGPAGTVITRSGGSITLVAGDSLQIDASFDTSGGMVLFGGGGEILRSELPERVIGNNDGLLIVPGGDLSLRAPVPEPGTWVLLLAGLAMVGFMYRRRESKSA